MTETHSGNILLVCQAGDKIGLGHLSRTLVAANALHRNGYSVYLLIQSGQDLLQPLPEYVIAYQIDFTQTLSAKISQLVSQQQCRLVLFDLQPQHVPNDLTALLIHLRSQRIATITVDALAEYSDLLDLVYTPSFQANSKLTASQRQQSIYGWDCFLLRVSSEKPSDKSDAVLILTGGSDTTNLGSHWLQALDSSLPEHLAIHWVRGPFAAMPVLPITFKRQIIVHHAPASLGELMNTVRYAVTLYGISFYELLYYGVPTVVFSPYGNKDDAELSEIQQQQLALVAANEYEAITLLQQLIDSPVQAEQLSRKAQAKLAKADGSRLCERVAMLLGE